MLDHKEICKLKRTIDILEQVKAEDNGAELSQEMEAMQKQYKSKLRKIYISINKLDEVVRSILIERLCYGTTWDMIAFRKYISSSTAQRKYRKGIKQLNELLGE